MLIRRTLKVPFLLPVGVASTHGDRRGTVIVIVTILVALLALGAYTFAQFMVIETEAATSFGKEAQARALADSGVDLAAAMLLDRADRDPLALYHNPDNFQGITIRESPSSNAASKDKGAGKVSLVASIEFDQSGSGLRFGLIDESSKININQLVKNGTDETTARNQLLNVPGMTEELADAILDFIDDDATPRQFGAEDEYYTQLGIAPRNGPLESLDELLLIRDVTPLLLYGEDANRNGMLDPNENDSDKSLPLDDGDGRLFPGWVQYFTLNSQELNVQADGTSRIDVNMNALGELYDKIEPILGQQVAMFIIAYRKAGPYQQNTSDTTGGNQVASAGGSGNSPTGNMGGTGSGGTGGSGGGGGASSGGSRSGGTGGGSGGGGGGSGGGASRGTSGSGGSGTNTPPSSGSSGTRGTGTSTSSAGGATTIRATSGTGATTITSRQVGGAAPTITSQQVGGQSSRQTNSSIQNNQNTAVQAATTAANAMFSAQGNVTRAGIDVTQGAQFQLVSLYDLVGKQVEVEINGAKTILESPFTANGSAMRGYLPKLFDVLTVNTARIIPGRININQARKETLMSIPGMTEQAADQIVTQQANLLTSGAAEDLATTGWLFIYQIADLDTLSQIDQFITARGDVFRIQSVGYFEGGGPTARVEAVIDTTARPPQIIFQRDLTNLGAGFTPQLLSGTASQ